jgi:hypothetical protein
MNTIHDPQSTYGLGSLKKLATRALLAGGLSVTAIGLGAGMAGTANAGPAPILTCPGYATPNGTGYVSFTNFDPNVTVVVTDASTGETINSGSPGPSDNAVLAHWPMKWSTGWHLVNASEDVFVGPKTASCSVQVLGAAGGGMAPSPPAGGGATPPEPPGTCSSPPPPGGCHGINGPGRPKMAQ